MCNRLKLPDSLHQYQNTVSFREAQSTKIVMSCAVFLTYPLQMYPVVEIFLPGVQKRFPDKFAVIVELVFRYILVLVTCKLKDQILVG